MESSQNTIRASQDNSAYEIEEDELVDIIKNKEFLADSFIDEYVARKIEQDPDKDRYGYISIAVTKLLQKPDNKNSTTQDESIFSKELTRVQNCSYVFIPVHDVNHFYLLELDNNIHEHHVIFNILDSLPHEPRYKSAEVLCKKIARLVNTSWKSSVTWKKERSPCPQQQNGYECGYFVIQNIMWRLYDSFLCGNRRFTELDLAVLKQEILKEFFPLVVISRIKNDGRKKKPKKARGGNKSDNLEGDKLEDNDKSDSGGEDEASSVEDDEETTDDTRGNNPLPYVNIHRININSVKVDLLKNFPKTSFKFKKVENPTLDDIPMQTIINRILKLDDDTVTSAYSLTQRRIIREIPYGKIEKTVSVDVYWTQKEKEKIDPCLNSLVNVKLTSGGEVSTVTFIPVETSLYAITSNKAYSLFKKFADFQFLIKVPERILTSKGAKCYQVKSLVGGRRSEDVTEKAHVDLNALQVGQICQSYSAMLKQKSRKILFPTYEKDIHVEIGVYRIKFRAELTLKQLLYAIFKLERIYAGNYPNQLKISQALSRVTLPVDLSTNSVLNELFLEECVKFLNNDPPAQELTSFLKNFDLCDTWVKEYSQAAEVNLHYKGIKPVNLGADPSLTYLLETFRDQFELEEGSSWSKDELKGIQMSFKYEAQRAKNKPFISYVNGVMYRKSDQNHFWRVNNIWYYITDDTIVNSQRQFQKVLKNHLLPHSDPISLQKEWIHEEKVGKDGKKRIQAEDEGNYNTLYEKEPNYYVGDKVTPRSIEYFDIIWTPNNPYDSYLYHVKHGFDHTTRDACSQLRNCAQLLEDLALSQSSGKMKGSKLDVYAKERIKKVGKGKDQKVVKLPPIFKTKEQLLEVFGLGADNPRQRVYVMGLLPNPRLERDRNPQPMENLTDRDRVRSLHLEKIVKLEFTAKNIMDRMNLKRLSEHREELVKAFGLDGGALAVKICELLVKHDFADLRKGIYYTKARLLLIESKEDFSQVFSSAQDGQQTSKRKKGNKDNFCKAMMFLMDEYRTYFDSLGAKMEIINLERQLRIRITPEQFKISEILGKFGKVKEKPKN